MVLKEKCTKDMRSKVLLLQLKKPPPWAVVMLWWLCL